MWSTDINTSLAHREPLPGAIKTRNRSKEEKRAAVPWRESDLCWYWCIYKNPQLLLDARSNNSCLRETKAAEIRRNAADKPPKSETWRRVLTSRASLKGSLLRPTLMALNWQPEDESSSHGSDAVDFHNPDIIWETSPEIWVCDHRFNTEPDQELNRLDLLTRLVWETPSAQILSDALFSSHK